MNFIKEEVGLRGQNRHTCMYNVLVGVGLTAFTVAGGAAIIAIGQELKPRQEVHPLFDQTEGGIMNRLELLAGRSQLWEGEILPDSLCSEARITLPNPTPLHEVAALMELEDPRSPLLCAKAANLVRDEDPATPPLLEGEIRIPNIRKLGQRDRLYTLLSNPEQEIYPRAHGWGDLDVPVLESPAAQQELDTIAATTRTLGELLEAPGGLVKTLQSAFPEMTELTSGWCPSTEKVVFEKPVFSVDAGMNGTTAGLCNDAPDTARKEWLRPAMTADDVFFITSSLLLDELARDYVDGHTSQDNFGVPHP